MLHETPTPASANFDALSVPAVIVTQSDTLDGAYLIAGLKERDAAGPEAGRESLSAGQRGEPG